MLALKWTHISLLEFCIHVNLVLATPLTINFHVNALLIHMQMLISYLLKTAPSYTHLSYTWSRLDYRYRRAGVGAAKSPSSVASSHTSPSRCSSSCCHPPPSARWSRPPRGSSSYSARTTACQASSGTRAGRSHYGHTSFNVRHRTGRQEIP